MNRSKEIKIESAPDEMFRVEQFVEEISDEYLLYGNYYGNILMALIEAVENAIIHGNKLDRKKFVKITHEINKEGLWIRVLDEGEGFDAAVYTRIKDSGYNFPDEKKGLFLISKLTDEVRFKNNGRLIEMLFRINGIDDNIFERRVAFMRDFFKVYQHLNT